MSRGAQHAAADRVGERLAAAAAELAGVSDSPRLDAEVLLAFAAGRTRGSLLAFPERPLEPAVAARFAEVLARRARGEPLAYVTGQREFYSLPLAVSPVVLVPRAETELLVELALEAVDGIEEPAVLDVGTGSGAIALALKHARRDARVTATDSSAAALAVASGNANRLGLDVNFVQSHWLDALAGETFDVVVSNPPYLCTAEIEGALEAEPRAALDGGEDGLDAYRALLAAARAHLRPQAIVLLEHGHEQRPALAALAAARGWRVAAVHDDLAGRPRAMTLAASLA